MNIQSETFKKLIQKIAMMSESDQRELLNFWDSLQGNEYARDMVKDYTPRGKGKKVDKPLSSGQTEASAKSSESNEKELETKESAVHTASKMDRDVVKQYWLPLQGSEFAGKLSENFESKGNSKSQKLPMGKLAKKEKKTNRVLNLGW